MQLARPVSPLERWSLDPAVVHLNHGSYGGCPIEVTDAAAAWRARLEANPMRFMVLDWQPALDAARDRLAGFLTADPARLVFVPSSTTGVAIALAAARLGPGDEILTIDHDYRACRNQLVRLADARGATITIAQVPIPFDAAAMVDAVRRAITPRTRLALFDHITSPTALVLPLAELLALCRAHGIQTVVDGAHVPGQLPLDLSATDATWYVGNNHKWLCAPKGSGFLYVGADAPRTLPVVTSHGASPEYGPANRLHAELDWAGTHDPSPHLAVPTAIDVVGREGGGWPAIFARNHALAVELRQRFVAALGGAPAFAPDDALGTMAAVPIALPAGLAPFALQTQLLRDGWEIPIVDHATGLYVRLSAHLYNSADQAAQLAAKLGSLGVALR